MNSVIRKLTVGLLVATAAAACGDNVTVKQTTTPATVHSVVVTPASATVAAPATGTTTYQFGAAVDADSGVSRAVNWTPSSGAVSVDANGLATITSAATGVYSVCAASAATGFTSIKGCAQLTVSGAGGGAGTATVQIDAITVGCHPLNAALPGAGPCGLLVPVQTNNVGGQADVAVVVNRPTNSGITGVKLDVLGGANFATVENTYSQTLSGDFIAQSDLGAQQTTLNNRVVFSVQTAAYTIGTGNAITVKHPNGLKKLRVTLLGGSATAQAETQLSFRNANGWHVQVTTNLLTGNNANSTCGATAASACPVRVNSTTTGLAWNGGTPLAITASSINFTAFGTFAAPGVGTGVAFGSVCDQSGLGVRASSAANTTIATGNVVNGTLPYANGAAAAAGTLNAYSIAPAGACGAAGEIPFAVAVDANGVNFINFALGGNFAGNVYNNVLTPLDPTLAIAPAIRLDNAGPNPIAGYATGRNPVTGLGAVADGARCFGTNLNFAGLDGLGGACPAAVVANQVNGAGPSINSSTAAAFVGGRTARVNGWVNDAVAFNQLSATAATQVGIAGGDPNGVIAPSATVNGLPADVFGIGNAITLAARIGTCTTIATCAALPTTRANTVGLTPETNGVNPTAGVANPGYGAIVQTVDAFGNVTNPGTGTGAGGVNANFGFGACNCVANPLDPANPYVVNGVLFVGLDRTLPTVAVTGAAGSTFTNNTIQILSTANFNYTSDDPVPTGNFSASGVLSAAPGGDLYVSLARRDGATIQYFCPTAANYQINTATTACLTVTGWAALPTGQPTNATAPTTTVYNRAAGLVLSDPAAGAVRAYYAVTAFTRDQAGNQTSAAVQATNSRDFIFDTTPPTSFGASFTPSVFPANSAVTFTGNATEDLDVGRGAFSIRFPSLNFAANATGGDFIRLSWANKNVAGQLANPIGYLPTSATTSLPNLTSTWTSAIRSIEVVDAGAGGWAAAGFTIGAAAGNVVGGTITSMNAGAGYVQDGNVANGAGPTQYNFFTQSVSRVGLTAAGAAPATVPPGSGTALNYGQTGLGTLLMPCTGAASLAGSAAFWTATQAVGAACVGVNNPFFNMGWSLVIPAAGNLDLNGAGVTAPAAASKNWTAIALGTNGVLPNPFVVVKFFGVDIRQPLNVDASGGIPAAPAPAAALAANGAGISLIELCTVTGTGSSTPGQPGIFQDQITNTWQYTCAVNPSTGGAASILQSYDLAGFNLANSTSQHTAVVNSGFWGLAQILGAGFNQGWQGNAAVAALAAGGAMPVIAVGCTAQGQCLATRVSGANFTVQP